MRKVLLFTIGGGILGVIFLVCILTFRHFFVKKNMLVTMNTAKEIPSVKQTVLGTSDVKEKTYVSGKGHYSLTYPGSWLPDELPPQNGPGSGAPVFTTGPVSRIVSGFPSFIQIEVDDNNQGLTLPGFINLHFDSSITFTPQIIAREQAQRTGDIQSSVPTDTILLEHDGKIYQIKWFKGAQPTISPDEFTHVLQSLTFQ